MEFLHILRFWNFPPRLEVGTDHQPIWDLKHVLFVNHTQKIKLFLMWSCRDLLGVQIAMIRVNIITHVL